MIKATHPSEKFTLQFNAESHSYQVVETKQNLLSVTTLINAFFPEFERKRISEYVSKRDGIPVKDILAEWDAKRDRFIEEGNNCHEYAEHRIKELPVPDPISDRCEILFKQVDVALEDLRKKYEIIASEQIIFSPDYIIAGTIDLVLRHKKSKRYAIADWKQNEKITFSNQYQNAFPPIGHLEDTKANHYSLQAGIYEFICNLEGYYEDMIPAELFLIHLKEDGYSRLELPELRYEVECMLRAYIQTVNKENHK